MCSPTKHLIISDSFFFLNGLKGILQKRTSDQVIYSTQNHAEGLNIIKNKDEIYLWCHSTKSAEELIKSFLVKANKASKVLNTILFSDEVDIKSVRLAFKLGISGFLSTSCCPKEVETAFNTIKAGSHYLCSRTQRIISKKSIFQSWHDQIHDCQRLSKREREVLALIIEEYTTKEIAAKLFISKGTVETHRLHLLRKLGVKNTAGLVREAFTQQLYA